MNRAKKIKKQYRDSYIVKSRFMSIHYEVEIYPYIKSGTHKRFSTKQEKSLAKMHKKEYKRDYNLKIRGKRDGGIPEPWDDYPSYVYDVAKSWKHNSKRKNQYYKEKK
jgi:hypothetical protein